MMSDAPPWIRVLIMERSNPSTTARLTRLPGMQERMLAAVIAEAHGLAVQRRALEIGRLVAGHEPLGRQQLQRA